MANNYIQATLNDEVFLTDELKEALYKYGANCDPVGDGAYYVYWETSFSEDVNKYDFDSKDELEKFKWKRIDLLLRAILMQKENKDLDYLQVQGANTCSKMRAGEFSGFGVVVTRTQYFYGPDDFSVNNATGEITINPSKVMTF